MSTTLPVPLTVEEEERQLELAILHSLQQNYDQVVEFEDNAENRDLEPVVENKDAEGAAARSSAVRACPKQTPRRTKPIQARYRRSRTMPDCMDSSEHARRANAPTLIPNPIRARSFDYSPPIPTYSTDCCEVREEIILENEEYIEILKKSAASNINPPIHMAVRRDHFDCLDAIIGVLPRSVTAKDTNGETPLFLAVLSGNTRMARRLIAAGADINKGKENQDSPLLVAIENGSSALVRLLLRNGANPNLGMNRGWTAVHECVYRGKIDLLEMVLNYKGDPNVRDVFGISPVFSCAACGRNGCLDMLLRAGGDPNLCSLSKTASPLFEACKEKQVKCALTLLRYGADPHVPNCEGLYPLHMACQKGLLDLVEVLLEVTKKDVVQTCGISPIHCAAENDEIETLELLIQNGYDVNVKIAMDKIAHRDRRQTALFFAVYNDSEEATKLLLEAGAETDLDYVKPLLVAESHRQYDIVDMLIAYGADINASFAGEGVIFPATAAFAIKDSSMFRKILLAGCDATRCFMCPFGELDHRSFSDEDQKKSFCHFITQEQNIEWVGWTVSRLLEFVGNITLCKRMKDILAETTEWEDIKNILGKPRKLAHLCRLRIRQSSGKCEFTADDIPLPKSLLNYVNHTSF